MRKEKLFIFLYSYGVRIYFDSVSTGKVVLNRIEMKTK